MLNSRVRNKNVKGNDHIINWMEKILNLNKGKRKTVIDGERTSSNGFLMNFLKLTLKFAKPFIDNIDTIK